ncbi:hypothetical protein SHJG_6697 [Streptomyces hygroscopicus subsp. jinggangensis 5008]|nr:hypothetical protein SHJG_6697 [Streptomyces hygroscopicus subsp. jinggangensis 5008]AGF66120.1 hypothetical protein SHJGH_6457 [Streptomyces hygroscopicus subsp. jinggangensis TL01]
MHAAGLYPPPLSHSMNPRNRAVSLVTMQGTPDVKERERMRGQRPTGEGTSGGRRGEERRDAEASLATLTAGSQPSDQLSG